MADVPTTRERILVALSGGVDSSVAALLLKRAGHEIVGAYMKNWINEENILGECPWEQDIVDARAVAERIGIDFQIVNLMRDYRERVVAYLLDGYARGITPNPDIMCNREIKFGVFRAWARDHGFTSVATGHYAQRRIVNSFSIVGGPSRNCGMGAADCPVGAALADVPRATFAVGAKDSQATTHAATYALLEGADPNKDQSYFLALLNQEQLRDARFPIGHLVKPELRAIAREAGLPTADKKDSQGICFIGEVKMQDFLRTYVPDAPGLIVRATDGKTLGAHRGLHYYTLGQRRGIGVPSNADFQKYVVVGKRAEDNTLLVAFDSPDAPGLFVHDVRVHSLQWNSPPIHQPTTLEGRVRYRDPRVKLDFIPEGNDTALIRFHQPQRALASGQVLALYEGPRLLGGGVYV